MLIHEKTELLQITNYQIFAPKNKQNQSPVMRATSQIFIKIKSY